MLERLGNSPWFQGVSTVVAIFAGSLIALKVDAAGLAYVLFFVTHLLWAVVAFAIKQRGLLISQLFFIAVDLLGVWRWLLV